MLGEQCVCECKQGCGNRDNRQVYNDYVAAFPDSAIRYTQLFVLKRCQKAILNTENVIKVSDKWVAVKGR